jgi:LDH2 family malate/lactate/ureidoglycolate dehydrogenase
MGRDVVDFNADDTTPTNTGHAIVAISIAAFGGVADFKRSVDTLVRELRQSRRLPGVERIWLPGEQSHQKRLERSQSGVPMPAALLASLDDLARELSIDAVSA